MAVSYRTGAMPNKPRWHGRRLRGPRCEFKPGIDKFIRTKAASLAHFVCAAFQDLSGEFSVRFPCARAGFLNEI